MEPKDYKSIVQEQKAEEPIIIVDGGKVKKKKTRKRKAKDILIRALKDYSEFSIRVDVRPTIKQEEPEMVIVAFVAYCPKEILKELKELA